MKNGFDKTANKAGVPPTKEQISEWLRTDLNIIVSLVNLVRTDADVFGAIVEHIYQRAVNEHAGSDPDQIPLFEEKGHESIRE